VALSRALETLGFCAETSTTLTEGIQPFNLIPLGFSSQATEAAAASNDYDEITRGGQQINYHDYQAIQGRHHLVLPTSTSGVGVHIRTAYITLATMLGAYHPFTANMSDLLEAWVGAEMELPNLIAPIPNGAASCVLWMTLRFHQFFAAARTYPMRGTPQAPNMTEIVDQLRLLTFQHLAPPIPIKYLPTGRPGPAPRITGTPPDPGFGGNEGRPGNRVVNPTPNAAFRAYDKAGRLGTVLAKHPVPTNAQGKPVCLSYHLRNACNSACPRAGDHRAHTPAEDNIVLAWAKLAFAPST